MASDLLLISVINNDILSHKVLINCDSDINSHLQLMDEFIKSKFSPEHYVGHVNEKTLLDSLPNSYGLIIDGNKINIFLKENKIEKGWMTNTITPMLKKVGHFELIDLNINEEINKLLLEKENENNNLYQILKNETETRSNLELQMKKYGDYDSLQKNNSDNMDNIIKLNSEIINLRKKLDEKNKEIISLQEDAKFAVREHHTPAAKPINNMVKYSACINDILNFNRAKLITREKRDKLINKQ